MMDVDVDARFNGYTVALLDLNTGMHKVETSMLGVCLFQLLSSPNLSSPLLISPPSKITQSFPP